MRLYANDHHDWIKYINLCAKYGAAETDKVMNVVKNWDMIQVLGDMIVYLYKVMHGR